jgi:alpha-tubulin suppressor-like RCC1 family protein
VKRPFLLVAAAALVLVAGAPAAGPPLKSIAAGYYHTCALLSTGAVKCWGSNEYGQLADGTTKERHSAVLTAGISGTVESLSSGAQHTCALIQGGTVECWGWNESGQLGNGTTGEHQPPHPVTGLTGVVSISAGGIHTCALLTGGAVKCWGDNRFGQLGNGSTENSDVPVDVSGLDSGVLAIAAGGLHTCALLAAGALRCWGNNQFGQLGDGTTSDRKVPAAPKLSGSVRTMAAGTAHTCALLTSGAMRCWGDDEGGQLGNDEETVSHPTPVAVQDLPAGVQSLAAGFTDTCALTSAGKVSCWGKLFEDTPEDVEGLSGITAITLAGGDLFDDHACAILGDGGAKCWGANDDGQVGNGITDSLHFTPASVLGLVDGVRVLTVLMDGHGMVTGSGIRCRDKCAYERADGTSVVLTAKASKGWAFGSWGGACKGRKPRCTVKVNATSTVAAHFRKRG